MNEFFDYLRQMGGLHDALVERFVWQPEERTLTFEFDDVNANFDGLPGYLGKQPGSIILRGVIELAIAIEADEPLRIFDFLPHEGARDEVLVTFSPSGTMRARFSSAEFPSAGKQGGSIGSDSSRPKDP